MALKKLSFYGDSLMIPRPGLVAAEGIHPRLLQSWLHENSPGIVWEVLQRACGSHTIREIADWTASDAAYFTDIPGGIAVVQSGIVDGAPRPVNQRVRRFIGRLPEVLRKPVIHFLHHQRSRILRGGLGSVITPLDHFEKTADVILRHVCETHDQVFVVTICPTTPRTEQHSPGLTRNIAAYNEVWHRAHKKHADKLVLIDVHAFISSQPDMNRWILEDGHHITSEAHRWIADEIIRALKQRWLPGVSAPP